MRKLQSNTSTAFQSAPATWTIGLMIGWVLLSTMEAVGAEPSAQFDQKHVFEAAAKSPDSSASEGPPWADNFDFRPHKPGAAAKRVLLQATYAVSIGTGTSGPGGLFSAQKSRAVAWRQNPKLKQPDRTFRVLQTGPEAHNYLVLGSKVSSTLVDGVYAYFAYHAAPNEPIDNTRGLMLGGRLEF